MLSPAHFEPEALRRDQTFGMDRRKEPRIKMDAPARVKVIYPLISTGSSIQARILDRSSSGMKLQVPHSIFVGALVMVRTANEICFGTARYCISAGAEFHVGIHVKEVA